jgi:UDP-N-acetylmuramoylalanine--D-glutamate ligase
MDYLQGKKIGIWGVGIGGKALIRYFSHKEQPLSAFDTKDFTIEEYDFLAHHRVQIYTQDNLIPFLEENDYLFPSAGIDIKPYSSYTHKCIPELSLFCNQWQQDIIAITGTVGKTSITHLLSQLLLNTGYDVTAGGNIGIGMLDLLHHKKPSTIALLELSSFQLEYCKNFSPTVAIITNIYPNHLDRHKTMDAYIAAKSTIFTHQKDGLVLVPLELAPLLYKHRSSNQACCFFTHHSPSQDDLVVLRPQDVLYYTNNLGYFCKYVTQREYPLAHHNNMPNLSYKENWLIITAVLDMLTLPLTIIKNTSLHIPEHRLDYIGTFQGISYYNDSKSTLPQATLAAVKKFSGNSIILLLGGISKGVDRFTLLEQLIGRVNFIVCFGSEASLLHLSCKQLLIPSTSCTTLEQALEQAQNRAKKGTIVLLSPAGASYDLFKNYQERGEQFKHYILSQNQET